MASHASRHHAGSLPLRRTGPTAPARRTRPNALRDLQQRQGNAYVSRVVQRRLLLEGARDDVDRFLALLERHSGLALGRRAEGERWQVTAGEAVAGGSPSLRWWLRKIILDDARDAEAALGRGRPGVAFGAFPQPGNLTGSLVQQIDIGNVELAEKVDGAGAVAAVHELWENYVAHSLEPGSGGWSQYATAHAEALAVERDVGKELVGGSGRLGLFTEEESVGSDLFELVLQDYGAFFLEFRFAKSSDFTNAVRTLVRTRKLEAETGKAGRPIVFAPDSAQLSAAATRKLEVVRAVLRNAGPVTVRLTSVRGEADTGDGEQIALERAEVVSRAIVGGDTDRVFVRVSDVAAAQPAVELEMAWPKGDPAPGEVSLA